LAIVATTRMKLHLHQPLYSAIDLLNFLGCTHATALDFQLIGGALAAPTRQDDAYLEILKEKGLDHEGVYLEKLKAEGRSIVEIERIDSIDVMAERTRKAMRDGADVIYQGALTAPGWHGYSDFLLKVDTPSDLGDYSYEVADTKLARTAKPKHVVQLCVYSEMISREQGVRPAHAHVMLGDGSEVTLRLHDYVYYCNRARERFDLFVSGKERVTTAERCPHCKLCHWSERCDDEWEKAGNLRLVAALSGAQAKRLRAAGITTIDSLGSLDTGVTIPKMQESTIERLRSQARLQIVKRTSGENRVEVLPPLDRRGFARLPPPSEGDLFFDMEGDPVFSSKGSLEYLFGFHYKEAGEDRYKAFWARDRASERKAFEDALDFITTRLEQYPDAYVYHYASYEQTALKRLAQEYGSSSRHIDALKRLSQMYGTRENEVDDLLRNRKMVDLYKVVRESVQTSEPRYSLKNLEIFFKLTRTQEIKHGDDSIVAFEKWLKVGDDSLLKQIEEYNAVDCISTRFCRDWLLSLRPADTKWFNPEEEKAADELAKEAEREKNRREDDAVVLAMREALVDGVEGDERECRELLGYLIEYHRRDARREWQQFFQRLDPAHDHIDDVDCIGCLTVDPHHRPRPEKKSRIWRLNFPEQDFKLCVGKTPVRSDTGKGAGEITALNEAERWLELKVGPTKPPFEEVTSLIPSGPMKDEPMRMAIRRYAEAVIAGRADDYAAVTSILRKERPRLEGSVILDGNGDLLSQTVDAVARMNHTHLVIQGPPGCGKTFTSAHAIVSLLANNKRVGVTSMSHKAINLLMQNVEEIARERGVAFTGIKRSTEDDQRLNSAVIDEAAKNDEVFEGNHALIGGTAWLFSQPELDKKLDYLFVDEAGQVSLADLVATGLCAENVVLVGDQMQLPQVSQGKHPAGSGVSGLDYLMGDWATVPPDRGIFLERTWRMHPRLCRFISDAFYDGRLESAECTAGQMLILNGEGEGALGPFGLRFVPVEHQDNAQKSIEEAMALERAYRALLGQPWINQKGEQHEITTEDILVVSPYNMQVNLLKQRLPAGARVGTVDKFQGQEAAVVLVSMASSSADDAPRGIDFLFSRNRLNVALSRARCLSVIFCSPALLDAVCADLKRMRLVNTVCWAKEFAEN
jgi:predicted RecB family nuclease